MSLPSQAPAAKRYQPTRSRRALLTVLAVLLLGGIVELAAWFVEGVLQHHGVVYLPPPPDSFGDYLEIRDPLLGWPSRTPERVRDAGGSRIVPAFPDPAEESCLSLYGDSFAWGAEVDDEAAWGNLLARRLGCRVSNFGVAGYGTDQAFLRFRANDLDRSRSVLLCHMSENIARNVNQFRAFLRAPRGLSLKPRFVLDEHGGLELVPPLTLTMPEYERMVWHPEEYLKYEGLLPGTPWGPTWGGFPHTLTVLATLGNKRVLSHLSGGAFWNQLYDPDNPTQALAITTAIVEAFAAEASRQERRGAVIMFPTYGDLVARQGGGPWSYQSLLDAMRERGIKALNVGDQLIERLASADPQSIATDSTWHYNEAGNRLVAEIVGGFVEEWGVTRPAVQAGNMDRARPQARGDTPEADAMETPERPPRHTPD